MKRLFQAMTVFLISLVLLSQSPIQINAASNIKILWVPLYQQEKASWCWNASAQMIGHYLYTFRSQNAISSAVFGTTANVGRTVSETALAVNYATGGGYNYIADYNGHLGYWRYAKSIDNGKPYILGLLYRGGNSGHMIVGRGYKWDTVADTYYLYINDPEGTYERYVNYAKLSSSIEPYYPGYWIKDNVMSSGNY